MPWQRRTDRREDGRAGARVSAGADLHDPVRRDEIRPGLDPRGLQDADRGRRSGAARHRLFVQDWRAILVPATTVPVTIIGAFAAMAAFGFTVNLASLFAVVLAIGIVVDDAIVIVEGASRHIEAGLSRRDGGDQGHGRAVRADYRHHAGADGGIRPGRLSARPERPDVCAVRAGHCGDGVDQRGQRGDPEADAVRDVASGAGAARAAQSAYRGFNRVYDRSRQATCALSARSPGAAPRWRRLRLFLPAFRYGACCGCRPRSSREKTRVT